MVLAIANDQSATPSGAISISSPDKIGSITLTSSMGFLQTPKSGYSYTQGSTSTCGAIALAIQRVDNGIPIEEDAFSAGSTKNCDNTDSGSKTGSYTLSLTSVSAVAQSTLTGTFYKIHGTLDATLDGDKVSIPSGADIKGSVRIQLSF